jgi:uncharacterized protein (DUF1697 family)
MMFAIMTAMSKSSIHSKSKPAALEEADPSACALHVALLRGINVGGKNILPMKELAGIFADAGCRNVRTYIQSGNVVFASDPGQVDGLGRRISEEIAARHSLRVPVIVRSAEEMRTMLHSNPFVKARVDVSHLHVYFLAEACAVAAVKALDIDRSPGDSFVVAGREIYLHLPNGVAPTKLTNVYFDKQLKTVSTLRNWRTALTLGTWMGIE